MNRLKNLFGNPLSTTLFAERPSEPLSREAWESRTKFDDMAHQHREFIRQYVNLR